jgi:hypothetical protein
MGTKVVAHISENINNEILCFWGLKHGLRGKNCHLKIIITKCRSFLENRMRATKMLLLKKQKRKPRKHQIALEILPGFEFDSSVCILNQAVLAASSGLDPPLGGPCAPASHSASAIAAPESGLRLRLRDDNPPPFPRPLTSRRRPARRPPPARAPRLPVHRGSPSSYAVSSPATTARCRRRSFAGNHSN